MILVYSVVRDVLVMESGTSRGKLGLHCRFELWFHSKF
jgi:hypothetical protein